MEEKDSVLHEIRRLEDRADRSGRFSGKFW